MPYKLVYIEAGKPVTGSALHTRLKAEGVTVPTLPPAHVMPETPPRLEGETLTEYKERTDKTYMVELKAFAQRQDERFDIAHAFAGELMLRFALARIKKGQPVPVKPGQMLPHAVEGKFRLMAYRLTGCWPGTVPHPDPAYCIAFETVN